MICFSFAGLAVSQPLLAKGPPAADQSKPRIEVCFVLDTTGSMGGLIDGAKQKIWSIANEIVSAKPTPQLKLGLIGYRDRGDEYVVKSFNLTDDIRFGPEIVRRLLDAGIPREVLINVNFPNCMPNDVKGIAVTSQGRHHQERLVDSFGSCGILPVTASSGFIASSPAGIGSTRAT